MGKKTKFIKTIIYALLYGHKVVYIGMTGRSVEERISEHRRDGKRFTNWKIIRVIRSLLRGSDTCFIAAYMKNHGGKAPKYNKAKPSRRSRSSCGC